MHHACLSAFKCIPFETVTLLAKVYHRRGHRHDREGKTNDMIVLGVERNEVQVLSLTEEQS